MDKKNVVAKFETKINAFGNLLAEILMVLSTVPAGTLSERSVHQLTSFLQHESACLWATVELMGMLNKSGGMPFTSSELHQGFNHPASEICTRKEEVIWDLNQQLTLHNMYRCM